MLQEMSSVSVRKIAVNSFKHVNSEQEGVCAAPYSLSIVLT